ncbi:MAG: hypothetical protein QW035_00160 [Candidatus Anstonellales archaeon]
MFRYGAKIMKMHKAVLSKKRARYQCPKCFKNSLKRSGNAIWVCRSCNAKIAGAAYTPTTGAGETIRKVAK